MKKALPIFALCITAALWTLMGLATADLFRRCMVLWGILGLAWFLTEVLARATPPDDLSKWIERTLPQERLRFSAGRRVFAAALGVIFLVAFWSWGSQVRGLVGERGLIPAGEQLAAARAAGSSWMQVPSLCWLASGDTSLLVQCWLGALLAIAMCAGFFPGACALLCWALYLSLMSVGESFGGFQWDSLLLETSLLAALWLPWKLRPDWGRETLAQHIGRWLLWWLLFRLMIESGVVKLTWGDETWLGYSALDYHFETQPLPLWTAWYAHQSPRWMLRAGSWITYFIEIATPVLLLAPPRWKSVRHAAAITQISLQAVIAATGNYTYFNLLTAALCIPFLDDSFPFSSRLRKPPVPFPKPYAWTLAPAAALALASAIWTFEGLSGAFGGVTVQQEKVKRIRDEYERIGNAPAPPWHQSLRSFNDYGLFRTMTRSRPEIVIEGTADGVNWREYQFPYKAGDLYRRPALVAPFQPRLDWQMWFAALHPNGHVRLLERLLQRLLEAEPCVLALLEKNPFPNSPPRQVRMTFYEYHFTRFEDHTAAWWRRDLRGSTRAVSLENLRKPDSKR